MTASKPIMSRFEIPRLCEIYLKATKNPENNNTGSHILKFNRSLKSIRCIFVIYIKTRTFNHLEITRLSAIAT